MTDHVVASIRVNCERCGKIEVAMGSVRLVMAGAGLDQGGHNLVEFACPGCGIPGSIPVDERVARLIMATEVTLVPSPPSGQSPRKRVSGVSEER